MSRQVSAAAVKSLRDLTGAGMMACKQALTEAGGDLERAQEILRAKGLASAGKRAGRRAAEGRVEAYIHGEGRIGVLVELGCETDFVARTAEFQALAREIAMQVAARDPRWVSREDVPEEVVAAERKIYQEQALAQGTPERVVDRRVSGQLEKFFADTVLLDQAYIREDSSRVGELVSEMGAKVGEHVAVRRFARFAIGQGVTG